MQTIIKGIVTALVLSLFLSASPKTAKADVTLTDAQLEALVETIVQKVIENIKAKHEGEELPECEEIEGEEEWETKDPYALYQRLEEVMLYWQKMREKMKEEKLVDGPFVPIH